MQTETAGKGEGRNDFTDWFHALIEGLEKEVESGAGQIRREFAFELAKGLEKYQVGLGLGEVALIGLNYGLVQTLADEIGQLFARGGQMTVFADDGQDGVGGFVTGGAADKRLLSDERVAQIEDDTEDHPGGRAGVGQELALVVAAGSMHGLEGM